MAKCSGSEVRQRIRYSHVFGRPTPLALGGQQAPVPCRDRELLVVLCRGEVVADAPLPCGGKREPVGQRPSIRTPLPLSRTWRLTGEWRESARRPGRRTSFVTSSRWFAPAYSPGVPTMTLAPAVARHSDVVGHEIQSGPLVRRESIFDGSHAFAPPVGSLDV
jgi:hypothetical protein